MCNRVRGVHHHLHARFAHWNAEFRSERASVQACPGDRGPPSPFNIKVLHPKTYFGDDVLRTAHPAKQCSKSLLFSTLRLRLGLWWSSCAGQKDIAFSPLRLAMFNLSSTSSKSANMLSVSFEQRGAWHQTPRAMHPPLEGNLF